MRKLLFICNQNRNRSKTAEGLFQCKFQAKSAGLFNEKPVTAQELQWADTIVVMEESQRTELARRFPQHYLHKRILSLDIPDVYSHDDPQLVKVLQSKMKEYSDLL